MASDYTDISVNDNELLSANDVVLVFESPDEAFTPDGNDDNDTLPDEEWAGHYDPSGGGSYTRGELIIDDFDISGSKDDSIASGIGSVEPTHRVRGNKEYTFEFTLKGEQVNTYNQVLDETMSLKVELWTADHKFILTGLDYEDFSISGSDGEVVEFSSTLSALGFEKKQR